MNNKQRYIAASDFDGTLHYSGISEENRSAIRRFREAGNLFGIVTGRGYEMYDILKRIDLEFDFVITCSGAMAIKEDGTYHFCDLAENRDGVLRAVVEYVGDTFRQQVDIRPAREFYSFATPSVPGYEKLLPSEKADELEHFTQLDVIFPNADECRAATDTINHRWGAYVNALQNGRCLNIVPAGVDKGTGTARYADLEGVDHGNIYTFGDNFNDLAMLTRFHGCAVANAHPDVKAAAERVCAGVWEVLRELTAE